MLSSRLLASGRALTSAGARLSLSTSAPAGAAAAGPAVAGARDDTPAPPAGTYLLTGSCGQIGYELVRALASVGANVVATDARAAPPAPLPRGVRYERLDVRDAAAVKKGALGSDVAWGDDFPRDEGGMAGAEAVATRGGAGE